MAIISSSDIQEFLLKPHRGSFVLTFNPIMQLAYRGVKYRSRDVNINRKPGPVIPAASHGIITRFPRNEISLFTASMSHWRRGCDCSPIFRSGRSQRRLISNYNKAPFDCAVSFFPPCSELHNGSTPRGQTSLVLMDRLKFKPQGRPLRSCPPR
jgi:hypothetical protein